SNSHKTTDTFTPTFIPPSITSSKDLLINAKELINHSIISAKGDLNIQAHKVSNIGSLELQKVEVGSRYHYGWCEEEGRDSAECGNPDKHTTYEYTTTITEDKLKENTYDPAMMIGNNVYIKANHLINDTAIIYAQDKTNLEVADIINTQPIPKRTQTSIGTMKEYDRLGGYCGGRMFGFKKHKWNCHSRTDVYDYTPSPIISSIALTLPSIDIHNIISSLQTLNEDTYSNTPLNYIIQTNPLYTDVNHFISKHSFQSFLHNDFIPSHLLADITGMIDANHKNIQEFINLTKTSLNPTSSILSNDERSIMNNTNAFKPMNANNANERNQSNSANIPYLSSSTSPIQINASGFYGKTIAIASKNTQNFSNIQGDNVFIKSDFLLNENGTIIANAKATHTNNTNAENTNNDANNTNTNNEDALADSTSGNLKISGGTFKNISSKLGAKNLYLNSDFTQIISGTNKEEFSYRTPALSTTSGILGFSIKPKTIYSSSNTSLDALSSLDAENIHIKGEDVLIKGSLVNAKNHLSIDATHLSVSTTELSSSYSDDIQSHSNTTHLSSSLKGNDISINVKSNADFTSANIEAKNDIDLSAGGHISFNSASNSSMDKLTITNFSQGNAEKFDFTSTTTTTTTTQTSNTHLNNSMNANNVHIKAGSSLKAYNLAIKAKGEASMDAKDDITLSNLADTGSTDIQVHQEKSGLSFSSDGDSYSMSLGKDTTDISDKASYSVHQKQSIEASSIHINADNKASIESSNLIANNGDISISGSDVSISALKDNFTHQTHTKHTSNKIGISVPKAYAKKVGIATTKKALIKLGDKLDPNNPDNTIISNHQDSYRTAGAWLKKKSSKIPSPSLSQIGIEVGVGFTHTDESIDNNVSSSQASSATLMGNNIHINAKNNADILGSDLNAQNDIDLSAKNVHIASVSNEFSSSTSTITNTVSVKVSASIGKDTSVSLTGELDHSSKQDSSYETTQTSSNLNAKNLHINTKENTTIQGSNINIANSTDIKAKSFSLSSSENELSTEHNDSSIGGSLKVSYNGSVGAQASAHYSNHSTTSKKLTHNASNLNTNKLSIQTTENTNIIGSTINAKEAFVDTKSLNISATQDSFTSASKGLSASASVGANLSDLSSLNLGGNIDLSSSGTESTTHNNGSFNAENLKLNTQENLNIKGGNITAQNLQADIKGDMNIQSLQDSHRDFKKHLSMGTSMNIKDIKTLKPSFGNSPAHSASDEVKTQSGINVENSLQVNVAKNTDLKGAYINVQNDEKSQTLSTFKTNTLSNTDISNTSDLKSMNGMGGYEKQTHTTKTLASISPNIDLKIKENPLDSNIHRTSPSNDAPKEVKIPTKEEESVFDNLIGQNTTVHNLSKRVDTSTSFFEFTKPLGYSLTDVALKNTQNIAESFKNNKDHTAPKVIFKHTWEDIKEQSKDALYGFFYNPL
ncbi:hemagglutinin repeat-containing protein, partial [Helicobacter sp. 13S00482-2]|uniref:hemagglutinin repeat-containing protein n=1 Tax=Helicobacter sp. 13S00482-2 TaxID=1476200 RepID=UPI00117B29DF